MESTDKTRGRPRLGGVGAIVIGVAVCAMAIIVNIAVSQVSWRIDLTSEGIYTLSPVSEQVVSELDEPVEVRAFISPDLPPPYHHLERRVDELLMEYEAASDGHFNYEIIAPDGDDEREKLARGYGVEPVTIGHRSDTERSVRRVYKGVAFVKGADQEVIGDLRASGRPAVDDFEYEFTRSLIHLVRQKPRRIGVLTGLGGPAHYPEFVDDFERVFDEVYGDLVELEAVDPTGPTGIDDELSAVIAINLDADLGDDGLRGVDRFVRRGGSIGWFQSGIVVDEEATVFDADGSPMARRRPANTDLIDYIGSLGLELRPDVVVDRHRAISHGPVLTRQGMLPVSHPGLFPVDDIGRSISFADHFSTLIVPMPSTIAVAPGGIPESVELHEVLRTGETSTRLPSPPEYPVYEALIEPMDDEESGAHLIGAAMEGRIAPDADEARLLVIGSGELIGRYPEVGYGGRLSDLGLRFFLDGVEWLAYEDELSEIRGKSMPALVTDVPADVRRSIKFINIVVVPTLFAAIGAIMLIRRRRRQEAFDEESTAGDAATTMDG